MVLPRPPDVFLPGEGRIPQDHFAETIERRPHLPGDRGGRGERRRHRAVGVELDPRPARERHEPALRPRITFRRWLARRHRLALRRRLAPPREGEIVPSDKAHRPVGRDPDDGRRVRAEHRPRRIRHVRVGLHEPRAGRWRAAAAGDELRQPEHPFVDSNRGVEVQALHGGESGAHHLGEDRPGRRHGEEAEGPRRCRFPRHRHRPDSEAHRSGRHAGDEQPAADRRPPHQLHREEVQVALLDAEGARGVVQEEGLVGAGREGGEPDAVFRREDAHDRFTPPR